MDSNDAVPLFAALAQPTRLAAFRLLVTHLPAGLPAGDIARRLDVPHNTMSSHLAVLERAGLVSSQRQSRLMIYQARLERVNDMIDFLARDCCGGHPDLCQPAGSLSSTHTGDTHDQPDLSQP
ncbi:ArsR/SmtB family transcription factor [Larsenimonas rhizosphaerae]|uniref:Helix-turn-helix transcriptional regulator n=1 Tax=Larsenimonas rhizosphaerae TaxID=2944682 RepID=A0AA42CXT1_9GAMM|nr:helix-turn-helix transcriptional regulator [Larsenimonas rhizosphaerae]MCX2524243.1 helix-turn-helix transcriptional regulator [Larsenimonas rhizosphaerae]